MFSRLSLISERFYRRVLLELFIWRLKVEKPKIIELFGDSVVFDNNDAKERQGVKSTYKRIKGYHPLQISWGPYIVDAIFRPGSFHSNHEDEFRQAIKRVVKIIRKRYDEDVPVIILTDSGFFDDKNFTYFEEKLKIHYVCAGKFYEDVKQYLQRYPQDNFSNYKESWDYLEFGNALKSWNKFRRCIYTSQISDEQGQISFEFSRPDTIIYTNIGSDSTLDKKLIEAGGSEYLTAEKIIELNHSRGRSELVHRSEKEFAGGENLPFQRFRMNMVYYFIMLFAHFLYETYKRDVTKDIFPVVSYPNTFRRKLIDFAGKIITTARKNILKITNPVYDSLNIAKLWEIITQHPPPSLATQ